jgi:hypothetical protein
MSNPEPALRREWQVIAILLFTLLGAMSALLEILLVPLYLGSVIFPISLVIVLVGNIAIPRGLRSIVGSSGLAALPLLAWIAIMFVVGFVPNSMGDVLLPGYGQGQYVGEGLLLIGIVAGVMSLYLNPRERRSRRITASR